MLIKILRSSRSILLLLLAGLSAHVSAQTSTQPTANCHVTDGTFTTCSGGAMEWVDVRPVAFTSSDSYLYVNQDAGHNFLYLMYDFPIRTTKLGPTDSVHVNFDTVEQESGGPALIEYDVFVMGNGQVQILQQGKPTPPGRIVAAQGFGPSPNSSTPHLMAELQVPLSAGPPSTYSPDPLFWNATIPPTPPPPPCPTDPGKTYNTCVKAELANAQATAGNTAAVLGAAGAICSTVGALGCIALEPGLIALALAWQIASNEFGRKLALDPPGINFGLPPDPNYTVVAQPAVYTLAFPTTGLTPQETTAFNALASTFEQLIALEQAQSTALARAAGAQAAGNSQWVTTQMQAAQNFGALSSPLIGALPPELANLGTAINAAGVQFTFTQNDIVTYLSLVNPASPSSEVQQQFNLALQKISQQLGITSADQTLLTKVIAIQDPKLASSLGIGAFPGALSDPVISTSLGELSKGLQQSAPSPAALTTSFQATLSGDYVAAGVGLRGASSGDITISGIPAGASVVHAFLYWGALDNGEEDSLHRLNLNGTAVAGSLIGSGPDTCWGRTNSFTYRADVTAQVTGNGKYQLTGVAEGGNILGEGATLVVVYELAGAPAKTIIIDDGNLSMPSGTSSGTASFSGFTAASPVTATTTFVVGDGQGTSFGPTPTTFTGSAGTIQFQNLFDALDGPLWDTSTFNVSSVIGGGSSNGSAKITITGDCLLWSAQGFSVTSAPVTTPVIATAAVVEAGSDGDTVINKRGLDPADAPTIEDQIAMVVQFRIIQNPAISASTLTGQLVQGLVNDGVISSGDAAKIEAAVVQKIVQPVGPPTISGKVTSQSVVSAGLLKVVVQLTNTGPGAATNTAVNQIVLRSLGGAGNVTLNSQSPTLPLAVGSLAVGASTSVTLFINVPPSVSRFSITEGGPVQDSLNRPFNFSTSQIVFAH